MDNLDTKSPASTEISDLRAQCDALQHLAVSILILVIVISGTLNVYLLRQLRTLTREVDELRPQVLPMIAVYQRDEEPWMKAILTKFGEYGRTHPDFAPVLAKYNLKPASPTNVPPPTTTSPAPAPKK